LKEIITDNNYKVIHCHTPIPGVLTRLAAIKARKNGAKILYTAHGFHFYKGGPLKNWLFYYPVEWLLSGCTDDIITINAEDYNYINNRMWHKNSHYIKGIGVDDEKFKTLTYKEILQIRMEYGFKPDDFILLYIAEFIHRKNHKFIIETLPELVKFIPDLKILFAGTGILLESMKVYSKKLHVDQHIEYLGFRNDIEKLAAITDVGISSSRQEGLGLGIAEQMICSKPVVASFDRGHKEMVNHGENGFLFRQGNHIEFIEYIIKLYNDQELRKRMGEKSNLEAQKFLINNSLRSMADIYSQYI
jgi:glycosyltransferase EpsD